MRWSRGPHGQVCRKSVVVPAGSGATTGAAQQAARTLSAGQVTGRENREAVMGSAEVQGELWGRHPQTWAKYQESQMRPLYDATLDALEPLADRALLDAGCGAGLALRLAADRGAVVSGLDASAPLLEVARERTPEAALRTGDIQALPYDDAASTSSRRSTPSSTPPTRRRQWPSWPGPAGRAARSRSECGVTRPAARPRRCSPGWFARPAAARHARAAGGQRPRRGREPARKGGPDRDRRR